MFQRYAALAISLILLAHGPAVAASMTMLQFGSFETRAEAETRAEQVKQKHADIIGAMGLSIREVKLPPDNLTVYRTQAGPVASKATAQSICSQLASTGDECYVVETAMLDAGKAVASATADTAALAKNASASASNAVTEAASSAIPARDPRSVAALAGVNAGPASSLSTPQVAGKVVLAPLSESVPQPESPTAPAASPELQAAMDRAAANEESLAASVAVPPAAAAAPRSFWSRLNPFSESKPAAKVAAAPVGELPPAVLPAPITGVTENALPPLSAPAPTETLPPPPTSIPVSAAASAAKAAEPAALAEIPAPAMRNETPVVLAATPVDPAPLLLPPPPAPLKGFSPAATSANNAPLPRGPEPTGSIVPAPLPVAAAPLQPLRNGNVNVGEAQRVPLTQATTPPPISPPDAPSSSPVLPLSPSATLGQKTIWAQMGPFADTQEALAFWDSYRQIHPDFPVVRVRVTSSLLAQRRGNDSKWLRIGPFAREGFVSSLCAGLVNADGEPLREDLRCGRVVDLGVASSAERVPGYLPGSRYNR